IDTIFGRKMNRAVVTGILGVAGSILAAAGILGKLVGFLTVLGVAFPPIAGIMIAEYFFVKKWRTDLESTKDNEFPATAPRFVPVTLIIWAAASVGAYFVTWGDPVDQCRSVGLPPVPDSGQIGSHPRVRHSPHQYIREHRHQHTRLGRSGMRIGIDVGGTNTDAVALDGMTVLASVKHTTSEDVTTGIVQALKSLKA